MVGTDEPPQCAVIAALTRRLPTARIAGSGPGYERAVSLWNGSVTSRPIAVLTCTGPADVQAGVRAARELGLRLSVRGGGHGWTGAALAHGGLTLDLSGMRQVQISADGRSAFLAGGATSGDVAAAARRQGLSPVTGTVDAVGMVGLSLGGGYGPLSGRYGLAVDNIVSVDLVQADGSLGTVDRAHDPELFWALRGGGGNFGVVTAMRVALHPVASVLAGLILFPWTQASAILNQLPDTLLDGPDELTVQCGVITGPGGERALFIAPTWCGAPSPGERAVDVLARLGDPVAVQVASTTVADVLMRNGALFPAGRHVEIRPRNVRALTAEVRSILVAAGDAVTGPLSAISLHSLHGAAARVPAEDTAFVAREPHLLVETIAQWEADDPDSERHRQWARGVSEQLADHAMPGGYPNLLAPDETEQIEHAHGAQRERLWQVKSRVDPDGLFQATPLPSPP